MSPTRLLEEKMLKKTITYEDFNGDEVSEDFFFHMSKAELVELELSHKGGLSDALKRIISEEDGKAIIDEFKNIILSAYGKRSPDGKRFIKNQELRDEFASTEAYSTLFMELVMDTDAAIEFINGVVPQGIAEEAAKITNLKAVEEGVTVVKPEPVIIHRDELLAMSPEDFDNLRARVESGEAKLNLDE
jgi:hypothetical protein